MAYSLCIGLALGSSQTGLTLKAQLIDTVGASVGSEITAGFTEIGVGNYIWNYASFPDGHRGAVKFYTTGPVYKAICAINPEEAENTDVKTSTRSTYAGADSAGVTTLLSRIASALTITGGKVDVNDKTGFALSVAGIQAIWDALTSALTTVGSIGKRIADFLTGDAYVRIGAAGAGLTALGDTRIVNLDATVSSRTKPADTQARVTLADTVTTYTGNTPQTGDNFARLGAPAGASIAADLAEIEAETDDIAAIKAKTDNLPASPAAVGSPMTLTAAYDSAKTAATQASVDEVEADVDLIMAKTDNLPASPAAVGSAMTLTSGERNSIASALLDLTDAIETGLTTRQALRLALAALAGKLSGGGTTTITIRNAVADSKDRITATVDVNDNRTAITTDVS